MKQNILIGIAVTGFALLTVPAFAQQKDKDKKSDDVQQIIITRTGDTDEKTVIEIKGDKVTVNGKDAASDSDVKVRVNKLKDVRALALGRQGNIWSDDFYGEGISLFSEDSNRAMLGVNTEVNSEDKIPGARVTSVLKESAAEKAGLKAGDIITKIDDNKIDANHSITEAIKGKKPGEKVSITVLRDGKEQKLSAELGKWKGIHAGVFAPSRVFGTEGIPRVETTPFPEGYIFNTNRPKLGLSIQDTENGKGVKVIDIEDDGSAAKAGIKKDDIITHINDKEVNSADEVSRLVRANSNKPTMNFQVLRSGKTQKIEVTVPRKLKTADL